MLDERGKKAGKGDEELVMEKPDLLPRDHSKAICGGPQAAVEGSTCGYPGGQQADLQEGERE